MAGVWHLEQAEGALEVALHVIIRKVQEEREEAPVQVQPLPHVLRTVASSQERATGKPHGHTRGLLSMSPRRKKQHGPALVWPEGFSDPQ